MAFKLGEISVVKMILGEVAATKAYLGTIEIPFSNDEPQVDPEEQAMVIPQSAPVEDGEVDLSDTGASISNNTLNL